MDPVLASISVRGVNTQEVFDFHRLPTPGKTALLTTKPLATQKDLSLAYTPGVAAPCLAIHKDPTYAYDFTSKGNVVAVVSNGTAVLGLGNIGAIAGKPVMEGKAVLMKRFADIDGTDIEVDTQDVDEFVNCVRFLGPTWGAINLEDIKAPDCFIVEERLKSLMKIPVFHDDQHGTAIVVSAALINALQVVGKEISSIKMVLNGAGAAGLAIVKMLKSLGVKDENCIICDTQGVVYKGRTVNMNPYKEAHAVDTPLRTLAEALVGADFFLGCSAAGALAPEMLASMGKDPILFCLANPVPEIMPDVAKAARPDCIIGTGRSDYPNQINNVLGFPYIFRGTLDVRASQITEGMKKAGAYELARIARLGGCPEVEEIYHKSFTFGREYLLPTPYDPRLGTHVPVAIAKAAVEDGVAQLPMADWEEYQKQLEERMNKINPLKKTA